MHYTDKADKRAELIASISASVADTLDELRLNESQASELIEDTLNATWRGAVYVGLKDYLRKLEICGE